MDICIRSKPVGRLTAREAQECRHLTMRQHEEMQRLLDRERRHARPPFCHLLPSSHRLGRAIMLCERGTGRIIAWSLITYTGEEGFVQVYVRKDLRRRGLGRRLWCHALRFAPDPSYLASGRSQRFFDAVAV
jgi:GNAT superfamily N-acetyltransferase